MKSRAVVTLVLLVPVLFFASDAVAAPPGAAGEYSKHFAALSKLSVAVAEAMPPEQYSFRPHSDSMDFGELMFHIATTNYQFCAGLKDSSPPSFPSPADPDKSAIVKLLSDSFEYCNGVISGLTEEQMTNTHSSPDGRLSGREVLLAMYVHVAHHRGQAEIYLRDKGIKPPSYRV
jgi:uncharacterized damage-inducible protein DinB